MQTVSLFALLFVFVSVAFADASVSQSPSARVLLFVTGKETEAQLAALPKVHAWAQQLNWPLDTLYMPQGEAYACEADGKLLHASWFKLEKTLAACSGASYDWIMAFELSSLKDDSVAPDLAALVARSPNTQVFLKRNGLAGAFVLSIYRNVPAVKDTLTKIWANRAENTSYSAAFASFAFWNPSIFAKVTFL
jgi:hypothetical protein